MAVLQFFSGIRKLLISLLLAVFKFLSGICKLVISFLYNLIISNLAPFCLNPLHLLLHSLYQGIISICIADQILCPMSLHIDLCINLLVKILREHIGKSINLTGTQSGISAIIGYVKRTLS